MTKLKKNEFKCEICGEVYEKAWSDEEAMEEATNIWDKKDLDSGMAIICDNCFDRGYKKIGKELK